MIELRNWLIRFGCALEELVVVVDKMAEWLANSSPPLEHLSRTNGLQPISYGSKSRGAPCGNRGYALPVPFQTRYEVSRVPSKDCAQKPPAVCRS